MHAHGGIPFAGRSRTLGATGAARTGDCTASSVPAGIRRQWESVGFPKAMDLANETRRRVARRLMPFIFLLYIVSYLDRVNVGFAALQMRRGLGLSGAVFGLGGGIFFLGYFLLEVPGG